MNKIILISAILIASKIFAEPVEPLAPTVFAPWSTGLRFADNSPYPGNKGGYALTIENKNSKAIFCRDTTFAATLDEYGNTCSNVVASTTINFGDANQVLEILPGSTNTYFRPDIGNSERLELEKKSNLVLEFCDRQALMKNFKCGFNCEDDNRKFDEKWDETITGGTKKFYCHSTGVKKKTSDPVSCNTGFKPSTDLMECEKITCPGNVAVGEPRVSAVNDNFGRHAGEKREICQASGFYDSPVVSCFEDFRKTGDSGCVHKSAYPEYYLSQQAGGCTGPGAATSRSCQAAASRWCAFNYGYGTGVIQQLGPNEAGIGCYRPNRTDLVPRSKVPNQVALFNYCTQLQAGEVGIIQEEGPNEVQVSCKKASIVADVSMATLKGFHGGCVSAFDNQSSSCRAAAANYCQTKGGGLGYIVRMTKDDDVALVSRVFQVVEGTGILKVACIQQDYIYKIAPFIQN